MTERHTATLDALISLVGQYRERSYTGLSAAPFSSEAWELIDKALRSYIQSENAAPMWVSPRDRQPDVDGRLWSILTERRLNGELIGYVPAYEYYHFDNGWATDDRVLFWLDYPLHPLPGVPHE